MASLILTTTDSPVALSADGNSLTLDVAISGESNTGANVGGGAGEIYRNKTGAALNLKTLEAGANVAITNNADTVEIASDDPAPAGADTQGQYNDSGSFAGAPEWRYEKATGRTLIGPSAGSVFAPYTKTVVSQSNYHNASQSRNGALVAEAEASAADSRDCEAITAIAYTEGGRSAFGFNSRVRAKSPSDAGSAYGGYILVQASHVGPNTGLLLGAFGSSSSNHALEILLGDVRFWQSQKIVINPNDSDAVEFETYTGGVVVARIDSTTGAEALVAEKELHHKGDKAGFYNATPTTKPTVTGSKGGNAALASLISALAQLGLITDSTT